MKIILALLLCTPVFAKSGYAPVNGIKMYYEMHGKGGTPLVLIHGGGSTIDSTFSKLMPLLAKSRMVVAVEEQGHGRTEDRPGPSSFTQTADDVAELLKHLKLSQVDVLGFSNGASSAMQLTLRHPKTVRKLVYVSSFTKRSGAVDGFWKQFEQMRKCGLPDELRKAFLKVNPSEQAVEQMCAKDTDRMKNFIETRDEEVRKIKVPVLVVMGDQDVVRIDHGIELLKLLPQARLAVIPGGHGDFLGEVGSATENSQMPMVTAGIVDGFLNAKNSP